jgi:glycosyltransferase involved in cell wall biosynthesis
VFAWVNRRNPCIPNLLPFTGIPIAPQLTREASASTIRQSIDRELFRFRERRVKLLIAIPVFNEHKYVNRVLDTVRRYNADVLVIDDGSTDGTGDLLAARTDIRLIRHHRNQGYGQSLIDAFAHADAQQFDWVITMDCDEQHEPARIPDFIRAIETDQWDIVSGSRYLRQSAEDDLPPGDRRRINATITAELNRRLGLELTDAFCGYKAHRVSAMRKVKLDETGYAFPLQLWPAAVRAGLRITEIPVRLIYNDPNRHFGGSLDDPQKRLQHYLGVMEAEIAKGKRQGVDAAICTETDSLDMCGCSCG